LSTPSKEVSSIKFDGDNLRWKVKGSGKKEAYVVAAIGSTKTLAINGFDTLKELKELWKPC
jgi:hypothetical protein